MNSKLSTLHALLSEVGEPEVANPLAHSTPGVPPVAKEEEPAKEPGEGEDNPVMAYRRKKQFRYLKKFITNPYADEKDKVKPAEPTRDYFWNVNVNRDYAK